MKKLKERKGVGERAALRAAKAGERKLGPTELHCLGEAMIFIKTAIRELQKAGLLRTVRKDLFYYWNQLNIYRTNRSMVPLEDPSKWIKKGLR